jgi:signal transduction histidine kinase
MDWLDEKLEWVGRRLRNLSLRKSLTAYIVICIAIVVVLYAITMSFCDHFDNLIWSKYYETNQERWTLVEYYEDYSRLTKEDAVYANIIDFIQTWSIFLYSIIGITCVSSLFYRKKLKEPLQLLREATMKVGKNDLDIDLYYDNKDEMGELCRSFDLMRNQLITNNEKMWDMMEEQKRLNAAFAHDLRTPLTVLRGYTDFLVKYLPDGKINEDKLLSTLTLMSDNIKRLERYSNTMKEICSLEEMPVKHISTTLKTLENKLKETGTILDGKNGLSIKFADASGNPISTFYLDEVIFMEVYENIISNAFRFAQSTIEVQLEYDEKEKRLMLSVSDDGKGFSRKDLSMVTKPYYTNSSADKSEHFGIGLYICRILCEKHGGWIEAANRIVQGAIITAVFTVGNPDNLNANLK